MNPATPGRNLERLAGLYDIINIKLDKTGGLTEAVALALQAESMGFDLMVGNMLGVFAGDGAGICDRATLQICRYRRPVAAGGRLRSRFAI